jgi:hypothetical protein
MKQWPRQPPQQGPAGRRLANRPHPRRRCQRPQSLERSQHCAHQLTAPRPLENPTSIPRPPAPPVSGVFVLISFEVVFDRFGVGAYCGFI